MKELYEKLDKDVKAFKESKDIGEEIKLLKTLKYDFLCFKYKALSDSRDPERSMVERIESKGLARVAGFFAFSTGAIRLGYKFMK